MTTPSLCLATLVLGSVTAGAVPTPPTPPGPPTGPAPAACSDAGGVLFEIDHANDMERVLLETSQLKLYEGGTWRFHSNKREASGCLDAAQMTTIADDLKRAKWTAKVADAACAAVSAGYTQYASHGKVVWTQRMCQLEYLDDTSRRSLEQIENILVTASTPHLPPCCKK